MWVSHLIILYQVMIQPINGLASEASHNTNRVSGKCIGMTYDL